MGSSSIRKKENKKKWWITTGVFLTVLLGMVVWFNVTPFPSAMIIRIFFDANAKSVGKVQVDSVQGDLPVKIKRNIRYRDDGERSVLDVYVPEDAVKKNATLPLVIWTHGGAWISGDKNFTETYFEMLAGEGFVVVALNYDLAPEKKYPYQLHQINDAHRFIVENAHEYNIDSTKVVLAGSSAGAQLSAQFAGLITNVEYADEVGIDLNLKPQQLMATVLYSGIYDMQKLSSTEGISSNLIRWGFKSASWAYTGERDSDGSLLYQSSPINFVTKEFPMTYISGGNEDALTKLQSIPFVNALEQSGVNVRSRFFADNFEPALRHENQFVLDENGMKIFREMCEFLNFATEE